MPLSHDTITILTEMATTEERQMLEVNLRGSRWSACLAYVRGCLTPNTTQNNDDNSGLWERACLLPKVLNLISSTPNLFPNNTRALFKMYSDINKLIQVVSFFFKKRQSLSNVTQAGLKRTKQLRVTLNSWSSCTSQVLGFGYVPPDWPRILLKQSS